MTVINGQSFTFNYENLHTCDFAHFPHTCISEKTKDSKKTKTRFYQSVFVFRCDEKALNIENKKQINWPFYTLFYECPGIFLVECEIFFSFTHIIDTKIAQKPFFKW